MFVYESRFSKLEKMNKQAYQSLSHTNNVSKILDGWSEPFLHITAEKHSA